MERRSFLVGCSAAIAAMAGSRITGYGFAPEPSENKEIFVYLFLRGGCDGLNLVGPVNDPFYISSRPSELRLTESGENQGHLLKNGLAGLDFRLHNSAPHLKELYDNNSLAIIHAAGLTNDTRSHFDAMDIIERGSLMDKNLSEGWITRYLNSSTAVSSSQLLSMAIGSNMPISYLGSKNTVGMNSLSDYNIKGDSRYASALRGFYKGNGLLDETANNALDSFQFISKRMERDINGNPIKYSPAHGADYPDNSLGKSLKTLAQVIKMDMGLQVATVDFGGWDTHEYQSNVFARQTETLSSSLGAFYNDLSSYHSRLTIFAMSEFGRRLKSNKSSGTDHGHGNVMFALGSNIKGGKMYGNWPGLSNEQLDNQVDLAVTSDYRNILGEIIVKRLSNPQLGYIFPGFKEYKPLDFVHGADVKVNLQGIK
jgi:uncharacterized protein (DUF1501 family)